MKSAIIATLAGLALLGFVLVSSMRAEARKQAVKEAMEKAERMRAEAEELERAGREDEARRVRKEAEELREHLERRHGDLEKMIEKAERMRAEAEELERVGREDEARRVWREAEELREHLEGRREGHSEDDDEIEHLEAALHDLHQHLATLTREAERFERRGDEAAAGEARREMEKTARLINELERRLHARHDEELVVLERRIDHMRRAAENLEEAGMADWAQEIFQRAGELEREFDARARRREASRGEDQVHGEAMGVLHEILETVHQLRAEVKGLREEVAEMRERLEKDDD